MTRYRYTGTYPRDIAGLPVAPLATVNLDDAAAKEPRTRELIDTGLLVEIPAKTAAKAAPRKEGDSA